MRSIAILAAAAMLAGGPGATVAQDNDETPPDTDTAAEPQEPEPQAREPRVSEQAFTPSEEVQADTAVAFPTDI